MLLLLMFAVVVLCSPAGVLLGTAWLSYTAEDGAADKHRRAGAAGHTICPAARQCSDNSLQKTLCMTTLCRTTLCRTTLYRTTLCATTL